MVSIVLPTYNGEKYLKNSIDSCLNQTFKDIELIVVVDGRTDKTMEILSHYIDPRLIIKSTPNQGLPKALNEGFALAQGKYWSWTSDDNMYLQDAIKMMVEFLDANVNAPMVATDFHRIDDNGKVTGHSSNQYSCFLYRAEAAKKTGPYRPEYALVEDVDFFLRLSHTAGPIHFIHRSYYKYRDHPGSLSALKTSKRQFVSLKMHYDLISRNIEKASLRELFFDRIRTSALYRDYDTMNSILAFAREKNVVFLPSLARTADFIKTPMGWYWNKIFMAFKTRATWVWSFLCPQGSEK